MMVRGREISCNNQSIPSVPTIWKLYENPFYDSQNSIKEKEEHQENLNPKQIHRLHLPVSARKVASSFWDLNFVKPIVESELKMARAQIIELKAELECERKSRKKLESSKKKLAKELSLERKAREMLGGACKELSSDKEKVERMKKELEEERKMLRTAEVIREERVQMKLAEARFFLEEKLLELGDTKRESSVPTKVGDDIRDITVPSTSDCASSGQNLRTVLAEKGNIGVHSMTVLKRKATPEPENHHIKRGIKGFVEFSKVVQAIDCRRKDFGSKLECQRAQLKMLLKQ